MKFGKRRWEAKLASQDASDALPPAPVPESWTVRTDPEPEPAVAIVDPADDPETVVDGEAVELPVTEVGADGSAPAEIPLQPDPFPVDPAPVAAVPEPFYSPPAHPAGEPLPPPGSGRAPVRSPMPFPVAEEPVLVVTSDSDPAAVSPLSETGAAHASGHAPGTSPSWPEPVLELAAERPEVVVGAAFAGGLLLAMILRRLGN
jgi:hypothetical protein